jgi:hypothetical protein
MQQSILNFLLLCRTDTAQHVSGITVLIIRSQSNCRCSLWFPYECGGGCVLSRGRFYTYVLKSRWFSFQGISDINEQTITSGEI